MEEQDVAQVCLNGHTTNSYTQTLPHNNKNFCPQCGEKTITVCQSCNHPIRGKSPSLALIAYHAPSFCESCGSPFPWTSRGIQAAIDLAEVELEEADKEMFEQNIGELVKDSPQTKVAAARIKKIIGKVGGTFGDSVREIIVDIASETAKKAIWGK